MKKSLFALSAVAAVQVLAARSPVHASPVELLPSNPVSAPIQVDARQIQINTRPLIPFRPFPMTDLKTGQPLAPDAIITLHNGKQMTAADYFAQLNQLEQQFNALGYTLRQPGSFHLQTLKVDQAQLSKQIALIQALPAAGTQAAATSPVTVARMARVPIGVIGFGAHSPQTVSKSWDYSLGSENTLRAEINGQLSVTGSDQGVSANGATRASGAILGADWDLARCTGSANAPHSGPLAAHVDLYVVGIGDVTLLDQSVNQSSLNVANSMNQPVDVHQDFHFSLGPIPMSARVGVRGAAGVQYSLNLQPAKTQVSLLPQAQLDVYGQGGVDLGIASGGIGCDLTLVHDTLQLEAQASMTTVNGSPALQEHCSGQDNLEMLKGKLYAYASVDLGLWSDDWTWDIWDFGGVSRNSTLFNDTQTLVLPSQRLVAAE